MLASVVDLSFLFFISFTTLFALRKVAIVIGLVDKPSGRKQHKGNVPLVGGISICLTLVYFLFNNPSIIPHTTLYATCVTILVFVGMLDDKFNISFKIRFIVQAGLAMAMMLSGNLQLLTIGNILGFGEINLGNIGYVITIFAVIGAINAFNMVDGIDGLLGGISMVSFGSLGLMLFHDGQTNLAYFCLVLVILVIPYLSLNLGLFGLKQKVFMGDAGSMLIGFTMIWILLLSSQNGTTPPLRPVTALWLIAIPLMDMVSLMIRRLKKGHSPFKPDREHLHHIFQRLGLKSSQTVLLISFLSATLAVCGVLGEIFNVSEAWMFYSFIGCFIIYFLVVNYIWQITTRIRKILKK